MSTIHQSTVISRLVTMADTDMPDEQQIGEVKQLITHDFVLDVYEQALLENDTDKREAIVATAKVLSQNIGTYLVETE